MTITEQQQAAWDAYKTYGTQNKAANALGISRRSFRNRFDIAKRKMFGTPLGFKTTKVSTDVNGSITAMQHKLAPEIDHVKREGKVVKRSTLYGADGAVTAEWVMRKPEEEDQLNYTDALLNSFKENVKPLETPVLLTSEFNEDDLAMFTSVDEHLGVHLTASEVGQNYNLDDAVELMESRFKTIVARTPKTETCVYLNLGDQFHANDHLDVTPASKHPLHSSDSFNTVADAVVALNRRRIDLLLSHFDKVDLRGVAGNHDVDPMGWLFRCYQIAFEDSKRVSVEFSSDGLGVYEFGNNLFGYHHGHMMKPDQMAGATADRYSEAYGRCKMRYLHTGHFHNDMEKDVWGGFKWMCHRTMNPKDAYSYGHGYLSRQTMKSFIYNKDEGEVGRFATTLI